MKYLLDTMVLSEAARPKPDAAVVGWLREQVVWDLAVSVLTFGEIRRGVDRMVEGRRKAALQAWVSGALREQFAERVLAIDPEVTLAWGFLTADSERLGRRCM